MSRRLVIIVSIILWDIMGFMLLIKGVNFASHFDVKTMRLIVLAALILGLLKGSLILKKSLHKFLCRLCSYDGPIPISIFFAKKTLLLVAMMGSLGLLFRFGPLPLQVRALVDLAVGISLISSWIFIICDRAIPFESLMRDKSVQAE